MRRRHRIGQPKPHPNTKSPMSLRNPLTEFLSLLPSTPLQVGTVLSIASGTATIELPGGGRLQARGTATVGARVFVRNGVIEGAAPTLTYVEAEV